MEIKYAFQEIQEGEHAVNTENYQYWIVFTGEGQISSINSEFFFQTHDVLEIPPNQASRIVCKKKMLIGIVALEELQTVNTYLQKKNYENTELIRKVFLLAVELQGFHHEAVPKMMYHANKLMYETLSSTGLKEYRINPQIARALEELKKHYLEPDYDFNAVIAASSYSASHFHKLFHETTGFSPLGWIHEKRMDHAKYLLRQPQRPAVKDVAQICGYQDAGYFSKIFRKKTGMSPKEYALQADYQPQEARKNWS